MSKRLLFSNNRILLLFVSTLFLTILSCGKDEIDMEDCTGVVPTYSANIKPILDASCAISGCHDAITHEQGKILSTYAGAFSASQTDDFLGAIQHKSGYEPMPDNEPKLSADKIKLLSCWVQNGAPE